jgi:hypothetical protein
MDSRPYFFAKIGNDWCFIAKEMTYNSNMIPMELLKINESESFVLCRIVYTKQKASYYCSRDIDTAESMKGPDIYALLNSENKTIASIWKPKISGVVEVASNIESGSSVLVDENITLDEIRSNMLSVCGLDSSNLEINTFGHDYYHILS